MKIILESVEKKNVIMIKNTFMETDCWICDKKILNFDVLKLRFWEKVYKYFFILLGAC